ncbi:hypothetical protein GW17_00031442 [Ensete ventricosum]|nr:hypothetical protein GW17_00031442 [Ensete ventricosum]
MAQPQISKRDKGEDNDLELGGFNGDRDADEEDAEEGYGGVALPVLGAAVRPTGHAPHLRSEVPGGARSSMRSVLTSPSHGDDPLMNLSLTSHLF